MIACVILGKEFIWHKIERDEEVIQMLIRLESDFWNDHVLAEKMPAPDGSKAAEELLAKYYGSSDPEKTVSLVGFDEKLKRRAEIAALQDKLDQEKKQIEQEVKVYITINILYLFQNPTQNVLFLKKQRQTSF